MSYQALRAASDEGAVDSYSSTWDGQNYTVAAAKGTKMASATAPTEDEAAARVMDDLLTDKQAEKATQTAQGEPGKAQGAAKKAG